jgi:O-antigen/teichoic acid export membrane protein
MNNAENRIQGLIRRIEPLIKTDLSYLFSGGGWLLTGYFIQIGTGLVLSVAFANLLPKEAYGTYQFIISMAAIASVFTLTGMGTAVMQSTAQGSTSALRYGVRTQLLWSCGIAAAAGSFALYYFLNQNSLLAVAFFAVALLQPFIISFALYKSYLQARGFFRESVLIDTLQRLVLFLAVFTVLYTTQDPLYVVFTYFGTSALTLLFAYLYVVRKYSLTRVRSKELLTYSKHLSVMESLAEAANAADKALIWFFLGGAPLAAYALAQLPIIHLQTMFGFVRQLALPKFTKRDIQEIKAMLPQKIRLYFVVALGTVGLYILLAPLLFGLLFPLYHEAILYSQLLALSVLSVPRSLVTQAFLAHQRKRELYIINVSVPFVRVLLLALMLWQFGILGAIAAVLITELFAALLQWYLLIRMK